MFYEMVFCVLLEIVDGQVIISWLNNNKGF